MNLIVYVLRMWLGLILVIFPPLIALLVITHAATGPVVFGGAGATAASVLVRYVLKMTLD